VKLTIELVPKTSWYSNVRSLVSRSKWGKIRKKCYIDAGYKCEVCTGVGKQWPVECHEVWHYNDETKVQTLTGLVALCPLCHKVKHTGLAQLRGEIDIVINQIMKVNDMTRGEALDYIEKSFEVWNERSKYNWKCDVTFLDKYIY
jgi:hypothetical protein